MCTNYRRRFHADNDYTIHCPLVFISFYLNTPPPQASYHHAFTYIRQLAVLLRNALVSKTKDAFKSVYCWQGINVLELWARLVATHQDKPELRPLVYPVSQLLLGAARLVPTPRYFPLRLRLVRAVNRWGATGAAGLGWRADFYFRFCSTPFSSVGPFLRQ